MLFRIRNLALLLFATFFCLSGFVFASTANAGWYAWSMDTGRANLTENEGKATVKVTSTGKRPWSIKAGKDVIPLEKGKAYKVAFNASATSRTRVETAVEMRKDPYYRYSGGRYFTLDTEPRQYSFTFTMRQNSDSDAMFCFYLGYVDLVTITVDSFAISCLGDAPADVIPTDFTRPEREAMSRGIQFGLQFACPLEGAYGPELREEYFDVIKKDGRFDTIRLPVWWEYHTQKKAPYAVDPEYLRRVDWAVSNALHRGYYTILNMHWFRALEQNPAANKDEYLAVWKQISEYFKDYPDYLYFEILNEPNGKLDEYWNRYLVECYDLIRKTNPARTIIIPGPCWANMDHIASLSLPERVTKDPNVMIEFHPYSPNDFCFQGSPGNGSEDTRNIRWRGTNAEKKRITNSLDAMLAWSAKNNSVRLFAGEFCAQAVPPAAHGSLREDRLRWVRFVRDACERRGIPWNYYDFCEEGSKVYDIATGEWDAELMDALFFD